MKKRTKRMLLTLSLAAFFISCPLKSMNNKNLPESSDYEQGSILFRAYQRQKESNEGARVCNAINITLGTCGIFSGVAHMIGEYLKDKPLEVTGTIGSTISAFLIITTNCMQCCQSPDSNEDGDFGNL